MLILEDIYKSFQHHGEAIEVLRGIDLEVHAGESLAVIGASGVGKSTLLHIMGSLEPPSRGVVRFGEHQLARMDEQALCRVRNREIGFVFQFHHLLPEFNALENTMMPALIARVSSGKAAGMARKVLKEVGLDGRLTHRTGEMSGGEQQRVAIARALVMEPRLILADEPTGNLDWKTGQEIAELLLRLNKEIGMAMVIATHNQRLASRMSAQMEIIGGKLI
ncbi:MAG: ABC transporter ATP-binding protein [Desulfatiglandaceae bacterium]